MTAVFYAIGAAFEAIFKILPYIGDIANLLFTIIGFIATFIWIWYMVKYQHEEKGFNV
jgi:uncharacterized membrane protein